MGVARGRGDPRSKVLRLARNRRRNVSQITVDDERAQVRVRTRATPTYPVGVLVFICQRSEVRGEKSAPSII